MKFFDAEFCEREDNPEVSRKDIEYYSGAREYFERKTKELEQSAGPPDSKAPEGPGSAWIELQADLGRAVSRLGEALRFAGRIAEALECKRRSLAIWKTLQRPRATYLARIRLAVVLDQSGEAGHAEQALDILRGLRSALQGTETDSADSGPGDPDLAVYADFIHESLALVLIRQGDTASAVQELKAALVIREERGHKQTIERTRALLHRIE